ncbi:hypothetical protein IU500_12550 [Nocardia terpenica]|uniref:hypothetical protein n=1 Tax=Nocardia terpenica TaxID=455432 RepID=UPI0018953D21|nr:hypothetical protein [Nocardia terpenica]MBF6062992.1 hypothetical protein [Nocardia terpenica]MBF6104873.1 hypothetical protein [Nocardia terpenica]MBF6112690.1 hypothetical protein [Nocardia terpenica]MBF6118601.1 hypothetical protein [Nocardia terpenica]MBF6155080.1 hypothetical protein [Nocardia terpenica]
MTARSRTFSFPGGMVQVAAYDDDSDDNPGVYFEIRDYTGAASRERDDDTDAVAG